MIKITCDRCGSEICQTVNGNTAIAAIHDYHNDGSPERETLCEKCRPLELSLLPCPVCGMKPQVNGPLEMFFSKNYVVRCANCNPGFGHAIEFSDVELKVAAAAWDDFATRAAPREAME